MARPTSAARPAKQPEVPAGGSGMLGLAGMRQERLPAAFVAYLDAVARQMPFAQTIRTHRLHVGGELRQMWPAVPGASAQAAKAIELIERIVRDVPVAEGGSNIILVIAVAAEPLAPQLVPEMYEPAALASIDTHHGTLRQVMLPASDELPVLDTMEVPAGMVVICQRLAGFYTTRTDMWPYVLNAGNVFREPTRDPVLGGGDAVDDSFLRPPRVALYPGLLPPRPPEISIPAYPAAAIVTAAGAAAAQQADSEERSEDLDERSYLGAAEMAPLPLQRPHTQSGMERERTLSVARGHGAPRQEEKGVAAIEPQARAHVMEGGAKDSHTGADPAILAPAAQDENARTARVPKRLVADQTNQTREWSSPVVPAAGAVALAETASATVEEVTRVPDGPVHAPGLLAVVGKQGGETVRGQDQVSPAAPPVVAAARRAGAEADTDTSRLAAAGSLEGGETDRREDPPESAQREAEKRQAEIAHTLVEEAKRREEINEKVSEPEDSGPVAPAADPPKPELPDPEALKSNAGRKEKGWAWAEEDQEDPDDKKKEQDGKTRPYPQEVPPVRPEEIPAGAPPETPLPDRPLEPRAVWDEAAGAAPATALAGAALLTPGSPVDVSLPGAASAGSHPPAPQEDGGTRSAEPRASDDRVYPGSHQAPSSSSYATRATGDDARKASPHLPGLHELSPVLHGVPSKAEADSALKDAEALATIPKAAEDGPFSAAQDSHATSGHSPESSDSSDIKPQADSRKKTHVPSPSERKQFKKVVKSSRAMRRAAMGRVKPRKRMTRRRVPGLTPVLPAPEPQA